MKTRLSLTGPLVVARDIAHAKIKERLDAGEEMPQYLKDHPVYYAGPAKTPEGFASGSFGPTTAGRMDSYVEQFQAAGGSMVMLAKGNRSKQVTEACDAHGGFYLGSIGGPAARLAQDCIKSVDVLEYPELGMEAVWKIEVEDFPAFIVVDDKGNDFFTDPSGAVTVPIIGDPGAVGRVGGTRVGDPRPGFETVEPRRGPWRFSCRWLLAGLVAGLPAGAGARRHPRPRPRPDRARDGRGHRQSGWTTAATPVGGPSTRSRGRTTTARCTRACCDAAAPSAATWATRSTSGSRRAATGPARTVQTRCGCGWSAAWRCSPYWWAGSVRGATS